MASDSVKAIHPGRARAHALGAHCYVRVTRADHRGYIEFDFMVGNDGPMLEMILPPRAFAEYCATHGARPRDALTRATMLDAQALTNASAADDAGEK